MVFYRESVGECVLGLLYGDLWTVSLLSVGNILIVSRFFIGDLLVVSWFAGNLMIVFLGFVVGEPNY